MCLESEELWAEVVNVDLPASRCFLKPRLAEFTKEERESNRTRAKDPPK